jgi:hypothetical protein
LANDLSANGRAITAVLAAGPSHGSLTLNADGSFRYTPASNFVGADSFTYQAKGSDGTLSAVAVVSLRVQYNFSGFLSPISLNRAFKQGSSIPIKWQLTDANGRAVTTLSAVSSLTVTTGSTTYTFYSGSTNTSSYASGGTVFRNDGSQYIFNWSTKGFSAGSYTLTATFNDGTTYSKTVVLSASGGTSSLVIEGAASASTTAGALLAGDLTLYADNSNGELTSDEQARILDAVAGVEALVSDYGTSIYVVDSSVGDAANIIVEMSGTSAVGGQADGVLGCTTDSGLVTIIDAWNWYAGSDPSAIGSGQYDFQTVVTHELGHALGLGHSADTASVMYPMLATGAISRVMAVQDLNVPDSGSGACGLHASVSLVSAGDEGATPIAVVSPPPLGSIEISGFTPNYVAGDGRQVDASTAALLTSTGDSDVTTAKQKRLEQHLGFSQHRRTVVDQLFAEWGELKEEGELRSKL